MIQKDTNIRQRRCFALIGVALLALLPTFASMAAAEGRSAETKAALEDSIRSLRAVSDYRGAAVFSEAVLDSLRRGPTIARYRIQDAEWLTSTLRTAATWAREDQDLLTEADGLLSKVEQARRDGRVTDADSLATKRLAIYTGLLGADHPLTGKALRSLGDVKRKQAKWDEAESLYVRARDASESALGPDHPDVALVLQSQGMLYGARGDVAEAERMYRLSLKITESALGAGHPDVAALLNNMGALRWSQRDLAAADSLYTRALTIQESAAGADSPQSTAMRDNLAGVLAERGDFLRAAMFVKRSLAIRESAEKPDSNDIANSLQGLGVIYAMQGQYVLAESPMRRALAFAESKLGPTHPEVANCLFNLATLLADQGNPDAAEAFAQRALSIYQHEFGLGNVDAVKALNALATIHYEQGRYALAETEYRQALKHGQDTLGPDNLELADLFYNLAVLQLPQQKYTSADSNFVHAMRIERDGAGPLSPVLVTMFRGMAELRLRLGQPDSALAYLSRAADVFEAARLRTGAGMERATFIVSPYPSLAAVCLATGNDAEAWAATERASGRVLADILLSSRGSMLSAPEQAKADSFQAALTEAEMQLEASREADAADAASPKTREASARKFDLDENWRQFNEVLAGKYPASEGQIYSLSRVQSVLDQKTAIMGWLDCEWETGRDISWGYVIRNEGPVAWVALDTTLIARLEASTDEGAWPPTPFDQARACRDALRSTQDADATVAAFSAARVQPLLPALAGIEDLIVIPTGAMATIPIEALVDDQGRRLGDRFTISYAPSATIYTWLREARRKEAPPLDGQLASGKALLLGDPPFTEAQRDIMAAEELSIAMDATAAVEVATLRGAVVGDEGELAKLPRLRNSRREVQAIEDLSDGPTVLLGPAASEQAIVQLAKSGDLTSYRTIHLATHALVDQERPERSCLILSRADLPDAYEAAKRGERIYDGRLTVQEILQEWKLDADLVTLSACETGLGQNVRGEGLVGFAHAFLQAGARSLLVSLWKVDDRATSLFMTRFYGNLWERRMGKAAALREAKAWLRGYEDKLGKRPYESPYYWSAFILIGDRG